MKTKAIVGWLSIIIFYWTFILLGRTDNLFYAIPMTIAFGVAMFTFYGILLDVYIREEKRKK